jgi:predicted ribosomally synthesized peptide with nif11-like leader
MKLSVKGVINMEKMKELYQKVAADADLQSKFTTIIQDAEKAGAEETEKKLLAFAKEAGYDIGISEMQGFFRDLAQQENNELSETELDMVAGGKGGGIDWGKIGAGAIIATSVASGLAGVGVGVFIMAGCAAGATIVEGVTR